ncbi:MAG: spheroidene monooxygenase [Pseudomonadota bacterium]
MQPDAVFSGRFGTEGERGEADAAGAPGAGARASAELRSSSAEAAPEARLQLSAAQSAVQSAVQSPVQSPAQSPAQSSAHSSASAETGRSVTLSLFRFEGVAARVWAFAQMGLAGRALARTPGIGFHKQLGSGTGEGFTPWPNTGVYGLLATWPDAEIARAAARPGPDEGAVYRRYRTWSAERYTLLLRPISSRGLWDRRAPFDPASAAPAGPSDTPGAASSGPVAALTRATIKTRKLISFWAHEPAISRRIGANRDVAFKIGLGEAPWLRQVTFSVWPDADRMAAFARKSGPHAEAIRAVRARGYFAEELYARFEIVETWGAWGGVDPVAALLAPGADRVAP